MRLKRNSQKGFSLIELAIGLAVVTVLVLAISTSAGIRDNARVQSAANSVRTLRTAAENWLVMGKLNYADISIANLKTPKLLPSGFTALKTNPWGGDFDIAVNNTDNSQFDVILTGLPKGDADKLSTYFNSSANAIAFAEADKKWTATF